MNTKQLRQKFLSLAIEGKLVPQDANDEPAIELLKRIDPKIQHISEDMPFEVPESWAWCRIKDVGNIVTGSTPPKAKKEYYDGNIPFFKPTDLEQGRNVCTSKDHLSLLGFEKSRQLPPNSILVTCIGSIGKTGLTSVEGACNQQINAIIPHKEIFPPYIYYVCNSDFFQYKIKNNASATTLPILNKNKFANLIFPLPPLAEQKRIVERLEHIFSLIDTIEQTQDKMRETIKAARQKLLLLAIEGKLVPQDANEEPAIELLKRTNPHIKPIGEANPYKLPNTWAWCTINDIFLINPKNVAFDDTDAGFIPMANICDGYSGNFIIETRKWKEIKKGFTHFANGDIAVAKISPCLENRKSMLVDLLPTGIGAGTTELYVFRPLCTDGKYTLYFFKSNYFINQCVNTFKGVVGQQRVSKNVVENIRFPLPPLAEQKRIVEKLENLFSSLDTIESNLN